MESTEEIISRLKFIGFIQKDEKINVRHVNRQPNDWYTTVSRTVFYPDNRSNSLKFIRDVISGSFEIIEQCIRQQNLQVCSGIIHDLIRSKQGLINLKYTYSKDTKFCCDIDVLVESIVSKLALVKVDHADLFPEEKE